VNNRYPSKNTTENTNKEHNRYQPPSPKFATYMNTGDVFSKRKEKVTHQPSSEGSNLLQTWRNMLDGYTALHVAKLSKSVSLASLPAQL